MHSATKHKKTLQNKQVQYENWETQGNALKDVSVKTRNIINWQYTVRTGSRDI